MRALRGGGEQADDAAAARLLPLVSEAARRSVAETQVLCDLASISPDLAQSRLDLA